MGSLITSFRLRWFHSNWRSLRCKHRACPWSTTAKRSDPCGEPQQKERVKKSQEEILSSFSSDSRHIVGGCFQTPSQLLFIPGNKEKGLHLHACHSLVFPLHLLSGWMWTLSPLYFWVSQRTMQHRGPHKWLRVVANRIFVKSYIR